MRHSKTFLYPNEQNTGEYFLQLLKTITANNIESIWLTQILCVNGPFNVSNCSFKVPGSNSRLDNGCCYTYLVENLFLQLNVVVSFWYFYLMFGGELDIAVTKWWSGVCVNTAAFASNYRVSKSTNSIFRANIKLRYTIFMSSHIHRSCTMYNIYLNTPR